ncbi:MAG: hypothetical protein JST12_18530 [Armatimonadetes bacterium]|nr:hypothetical protein [Armatimonadota bacterium]
MRQGYDATWSFISDRRGRGKELSEFDVAYHIWHLDFEVSDFTNLHRDWLQSQADFAREVLASDARIQSRLSDLDDGVHALIALTKASNEILQEGFTKLTVIGQIQIKLLTEISGTLITPHQTKINEAIGQLFGVVRRLLTSSGKDREENLKNARQDIEELLADRVGRQAYTVWLVRGMLNRFELGDLTAAEDDFRNACRVCDSEDEWVTCFRYRIDTLCVLERTEEALELLHELGEETLINHPQLWFDLCKVLLLLDQTERLENEFERLISHDHVFADLALCSPLMQGKARIPEIIRRLRDRLVGEVNQLEEIQRIVLESPAFQAIPLSATKPSELPNPYGKTSSLYLIGKRRMDLIQHNFALKDLVEDFVGKQVPMLENRHEYFNEQIGKHSSRPEILARIWQVIFVASLIQCCRSFYYNRDESTINLVGLTIFWILLELIIGGISLLISNPIARDNRTQKMSDLTAKQESWEELTRLSESLVELKTGAFHVLDEISMNRC